MMITQTGRLLYISENAAEYLGHSMVSTFFHMFGLSQNLNAAFLRVKIKKMGDEIFSIKISHDFFLFFFFFQFLQFLLFTRRIFWSTGTVSTISWTNRTIQPSTANSQGNHARFLFTKFRSIFTKFRFFSFKILLYDISWSWVLSTTLCRFERTKSWKRIKFCIWTLKFLKMISRKLETLLLPYIGKVFHIIVFFYHIIYDLRIC